MNARENEYDKLYLNSKALLSALGYRDLLTRRHSDRVYGLSTMIATRLQLDAKVLSALRIGATFHDIGKIGIPDYILQKPGRFSDGEWQVMKQHSEIGEQILLSTELKGSERAADSIRHHHEHFDGSGYPDGLAGDEIPICSRIVSIADSYDAMAVTRSYHRGRSHDEIMETLQQESGSKHDPELMRIFCEAIEHSPYKVS